MSRKPNLNLPTANHWLDRPAAGTTAALAIIALGLVFTVCNLDLPLLRNALLYAQIHENLTSNGMKLWEVCDDSTLVFNKPCGFAVIAAPFAALLGANAGLKVASFVGTALFVLSVLGFFRRFNPRFGLAPRVIPFQLLITAANPLVFYQFWSAYPDPFFMAGFLYSLVLLDRMVHDRVGAGVVAAYLGTFVGCMMVKHWTVMFFPLHALYLYWHRREVAARLRDRPATMGLLAVALSLAATFVLAGKLGLNPLLNLVSNEGQLVSAVPYATNVTQVAVFLAVSLGVLLVLLPLVRVGAEDGALFAVALLYTHLFTVYHGSEHNARYYIPVLPFLATYLAAAHQRLSRLWLRRGLVAGFAVTTAVLVLASNERTVYRQVAARLPAGWIGEFGYFDCYRMGVHLEAAADIQAINQQLPGGARLSYVTSYYGTGGFGVYERSGLFRQDLRISYLRSIADDPNPRYVYFQPPQTPDPDEGMVRITRRVYRVP